MKNTVPDPPNFGERFDLQGHRGARALFPENTLEGFAAADALGVRTIEIDIAVTADDVPVICHDAALNPDITRLADGRWLEQRGVLVRDLSFQALQEYDVGRIRPGTGYAARYPAQEGRDGARVPSLRQAFAALPEMRFNIELKLYPNHRDWTVPPETMTDLVLREIDRAGASGRVIVQSFDWRPMHRLRATRPDIALSYLTQPETVGAEWWDRPVSPLPQAIAEAADIPNRRPGWAPEFASLTEQQVAEAHHLGLRVVPWTVNTAADMARLIGWGVDGLITDDPALALRVLRQAGIEGATPSSGSSPSPRHG